MSENDEKEKFRLLILPDKRGADLSADATLLDALEEADIRIDSVCGGEGTCGKCGVRILKGEKPVTPQDEQFFDRTELTDGWRLACQLRPMSDMEIELPAQPDESSRILRRGRGIQFTLSPNVEKRYIEITPEDRDNNISDTDLVAKAAGMSGAPAFDPDLLTDLPLLLREADYAVTITLWAGKVVRIEKGDTTKSNYGVALDVGTTTMVASLVNLSSGHDETSEAAYNPQRSFGEDVISRIKYCREHADGTRRLSSLVVEKAAAMTEKLCARKGISPDELGEIVAVGNPTMGHLFMGINPSYLGELPYRPVVTGAITSYKDSESLDKLPRVPVELPPNFSGFIGSDIVAGLLSQGIGEDEEIRLFVDIGTNAEIALGSKRELMVSNCAAGPAFEGAKIECGMSGMEGAIDKLWIDDEDIRYHVIGDGEARGICGSGLVDIVAALLDLGVIDATGRMADPEYDNEQLKNAIRKRLSKKDGKLIFEISQDVYISQKDIRELQAAKAAIAAGVRILQRKLGITSDDIESVVIAGAFGNYIDANSARRIGLLPEIPLEKIISAGNTALSGARMYLLSTEARALAKKLPEMAQVHELASEPTFMDEYTDCMAFPESGSE